MHGGASPIGTLTHTHTYRAVSHSCYGRQRVKSESTKADVYSTSKTTVTNTVAANALSLAGVCAVCRSVRDAMIDRSLPECAPAGRPGEIEQQRVMIRVTDTHSVGVRCAARYRARAQIY